MAVSTLQILGDILHPVRGRSLALQFCRDEYHVGRFGFVIDEARHRLYDGPSSLIGWKR
jgi:hypothetical protein